MSPSSRPFSIWQPAKAATSPSPVASTTTLPSRASSPSLVEITTPVTRWSSTRASAAMVWR